MQEATKKINLDEIRLDPTSHIHRENNPQFIASLARGLEILGRSFFLNQRGFRCKMIRIITNKS